MRELDDDERHIELDGDERDRWAWVSVDALDDYPIPRPARRLGRAYEAYTEGTLVYLEHGDSAANISSSA